MKEIYFQSNKIENCRPPVTEHKHEESCAGGSAVRSSNPLGEALNCQLWFFIYNAFLYILPSPAARRVLLSSRSAH